MTKELFKNVSSYLESEKAERELNGFEPVEVVAPKLAEELITALSGNATFSREVAKKQLRNEISKDAANVYFLHSGHLYLFEMINESRNGNEEKHYQLHRNKVPEGVDGEEYLLKEKAKEIGETKWKEQFLISFYDGEPGKDSINPTAIVLSDDNNPGFSVYPNSLSGRIMLSGEGNPLVPEGYEDIVRTAEQVEEGVRRIIQDLTTS